MIPLSVDRPFSSTPWVNYSLIALNILIFLIGGILPHETQTWIALQFNLWPTPHVFTNNGIIVHATPHLWQYITSTFLHGGFWHITGNMIFLWIFGNVVEDKLGHTRYLLFYLAGGIFSGIGHSLASTNPALGASGAIAAVMGAFLIFFPRTKIRVLWLIFLISIFDIPSVWFIGFFIAQNIWMQLQPGNQGVAYMAHLTGIFTGITVALLLLWLRVYAREPYDVMSWLSQWRRRRQFRVVSRQGFDPWRGRTPGRPSAFKDNANDSLNTRNNTRNIHSEPAKALPDPQTLKLSAMRQSVHENIAAGKMVDAANNYTILNKEFPEALLNENDQLALANHAFAEKDYPTAVLMYRALLDNFPTADLHGEVRLMLALTLARYLNKPQEAEPFLKEAIKRLPNGENKQLAISLLNEIRQKYPNETPDN